MKIGLMCGREYSFPPAFIERVNQLGHPHGISAEIVVPVPRGLLMRS